MMMRTRHLVLLVGLAVLLPCRLPAVNETPHPFTYWVRGTIDIDPEGLAWWSVTVRVGGYYTGYAHWLDGEFNGQLSPEQTIELSEAVKVLPRSERSYQFGRQVGHVPGLTVELENPAPTTRYRVAPVRHDEPADARLDAVAHVAELLLRLVPRSEGQAATPWRPTTIDVPRGRTRR
jgi:hypothetical protein